MITRREKERGDEVSSMSATVAESAVNEVLLTTCDGTRDTCNTWR